MFQIVIKLNDFALFCLKVLDSSGHFHMFTLSRLSLVKILLYLSCDRLQLNVLQKPLVYSSGAGCGGMNILLLLPNIDQIVLREC